MEPQLNCFMEPKDILLYGEGQDFFMEPRFNFCMEPRFDCFMNPRLNCFMGQGSIVVWSPGIDCFTEQGLLLHGAGFG